jgi:hypothetical protein
MPDFKVKRTFLSDFTLDKLRDDGVLDVALKNFGENGTSILNFYRMSGTWSEFLRLMIILVSVCSRSLMKS